MTTTRNHDHIKHRELYYNGAYSGAGISRPVAKVSVVRGWRILSAGPKGVMIQQGHNDELRTIIPWRQVIQFTYWHDDDIGKDVPDLV